MLFSFTPTALLVYSTVFLIAGLVLGWKIKSQWS